MADFSTGVQNVQNERRTCFNIIKQENHQKLLAVMSKGLKNKSGFTLNGLRWDHMSINNDTSYNKFKYFKYVDIHNIIMILKES